MVEPETLGTQFATALAAKDFDRIKELMHPEVDFRGLTPRKFWEANDPQTLIDEILTDWYDPSRDVRTVERIDTDPVADREHLSYRFSGTCADGPFVVEQQAYLTEVDGKIGWMRVLCSGFRPV